MWADRAALMAFACTEPPRRERLRNMPKVYPRPWERDVEAYIRDFRPPGPADQTFLVGRDDEGIGAVCAFTRDDPSPDWMIKLQIVAVDNRYRGQGGAVADEAITLAMQTAFDAVASRGHPQVYVFGLIDTRNTASQRMCQRRGFISEGEAPDAEGYEQWSVAVTFDPAAAPLT